MTGHIHFILLRIFCWVGIQKYSLVIDRRENRGTKIKINDSSSACRKTTHFCLELGKFGIVTFQTQRNARTCIFTVFFKHTMNTFWINGAPTYTRVCLNSSSSLCGMSAEFLCSQYTHKSCGFVRLCKRLVRKNHVNNIRQYGRFISDRMGTINVSIHSSGWTRIWAKINFIYIFLFIISCNHSPFIFRTVLIATAATAAKRQWK